ncbi:MAG: inorganic diphosphatase [Solirubrobacteraceae bacterium]
MCRRDPKGEPQQVRVRPRARRVQIRSPADQRRHPADYGYLHATLAEDGDPLDALVFLTEPTFPGCPIPVKAIGMFAMADEKGPDDKILCVPCHDPYWNGYERTEDLPALLRAEIEQFFSIYKELEPRKFVEVGGWRSREEALAEIDASQRRLRQHD